MYRLIIAIKLQSQVDFTQISFVGLFLLVSSNIIVYFINSAHDLYVLHECMYNNYIMILYVIL